MKHNIEFKYDEQEYQRVLCRLKRRNEILTYDLLCERNFSTYLVDEVYETNGYFWEIVNMVKSAQDLETLAEAVEQLAKEYIVETTRVYIPDWKERLDKKQT